MQYGILGPLEVRSEGMLLALGGPRQRAVLARLLVDVGRVIGDHEGADDQYRQALPELQRIGDRRCTASTLKNLATLAGQTGRHDRSLGLHAESISIRRDLGDAGGLAECLEG